VHSLTPTHIHHVALILGKVPEALKLLPLPFSSDIL
jgi:hypothetical protein